MTIKDIRDKLGIRIEGLQIVLSVRDMNLSRAFYKGILGFEEVDWIGTTLLHGTLPEMGNTKWVSEKVT